MKLLCGGLRPALSGFAASGRGGRYFVTAPLPPRPPACSCFAIAHSSACSRAWPQGAKSRHSVGLRPSLWPLFADSGLSPSRRPQAANAAIGRRRTVCRRRAGVSGTSPASPPARASACHPRRLLISLLAEHSPSPSFLKRACLVGSWQAFRVPPCAPAYRRGLRRRPLPLSGSCAWCAARRAITHAPKGAALRAQSGRGLRPHLFCRLAHPSACSLYNGFPLTLPASRFAHSKACPNARRFHSFCGGSCRPRPPRK